MELRNRDQLESAFAARIGRIIGKHRNDLIDLMGDPPDPTKVSESFWTEAENEMQRELAIALLILFTAAARQHGAQYAAAESAGLRYAAARSQEVAAGYRTNNRERFAGFVGRWNERSVSGQPMTEADVGREAAGIFGTSRAEAIAVTETTAAQSAGGELGVADSVGTSVDDTWFTTDDNRVCPICGPLHGMQRGEWSGEFPSGPPAHPNCRCWIDYANFDEVSA